MQSEIHKLKLLVTLFLITLKLNAQETWVRVNPVITCPEFYFDYQKFKAKENSKEIFQIKSSHSKQVITIAGHKDFLEKIKIISDEIKLTCQEKKGILKIESDCYEDAQIGTSFKEFLSEVSNHLITAPDSCNGHTEYLDLYNSFAGLAAPQLKRAKDLGNNILKMLAGKESAHLIDLFESCGGRNGKKDFLTNLILIEGYNQCIIPSPPGMLSTEELKKIGEKIGEKFQHFSLLELKGKYKEIENDIVLKVADEYSQKVVSQLLSLSKEEAKERIKSLPSTTKLKSYIQSNPKDVKNYLTYVYAPELSIELGKASLAPLLESNLKDRLKGMMSIEEQNAFLQNELLITANDEYERCIEPSKKRILYQNPENPEESLRKRLELKNKFCKENKSVQSCSAKTEIENESSTSCQSKENINLLSFNPKVTDEQIIKSCVMGSFSVIMSKILNKMIDINLKSLTDFPLQLKENIKVKSWEKFKNCLNNPDEIFNSSGSINQETLLHLNTDEFQRKVSSCAEALKSELTEDVVQLAFLSNPSVIGVFDSQNDKTKSKYKDYDSYFSLNSIEYAKENLTQWMKDCFDSQRSHSISSEELDPTKCEPYLETQFGKKIIIDSISHLLDLNEEQKITHPVIVNFRTCTEVTRSKILKGTTAPDSKPDEYLFENHDFFNCIKEAVIKSSEEIAEKEFKETLKGIKEIKNPTKYFYLVKKVKETTKQCIEKKLTEVASWPNLIKFQEDKGVEDLKTLCSQEVIKEIVPIIVNQELKETLTPVSDYLPKGVTIESLILQITQDVNKGIDSKSSTTNLKRALEIYLKDGQEKAIKTLTKSVENSSFKEIREIFLKAIVEEGQKKSLDLSPLGEMISKECIINLKNSLERIDLSSGESEKSESPLNIVSLIVESFSFASQLSPSQLTSSMENFKAFCKESRNIKDLHELKEKLKSSHVLDLIIKSQMQQKVATLVKDKFEDFLDSTEEKLKKDVEEGVISQNEFDQNVKPFLLKAKTDLDEIIRSEIMNPDRFNKMMFSNQGNDLIGSVIDGLPGILSENTNNSESFNKIIKKSVDQMFQSKSPNSFSDKLTKSLITNLVGAMGYKEISSKLTSGGETSLKVYKFPVIGAIANYGFQKTKEGFSNYWNVANVNNLIDWDNRSEEFRKDKISLIEDQIKDMMSGKSNNSNLEQLGSTLAKDIIADKL